MRHFTNTVDQFSTFVLTDKVSMTDSTFVGIQHALMLAMGANPELMTPSEERVLADFIGWVKKCKSETRKGDRYVSDSVFCYHNLNEGHGVVVVWGANALLDLYVAGEVNTPNLNSVVDMKVPSLLRKS